MKQSNVLFSFSVASTAAAFLLFEMLIAIFLFSSSAVIILHFRTKANIIAKSMNQSLLAANHARNAFEKIIDKPSLGTQKSLNEDKYSIVTSLKPIAFEPVEKFGLSYTFVSRLKLATVQVLWKENNTTNRSFVLSSIVITGDYKA